ncbi:hypothetical protein B7486_55790 [cyanobacterium TDX16]|nr:hypothetical protein B7486_55790 [cyanobacterium TDX16]
MTAAWATPDPGAVAPPPPDPRTGRGPWPLAPLTVPIALAVGTVLSGALSALVLVELPWADRLDAGGLFTFAFGFGLVLTGLLVALSATTRARPSLPRALLGTLGTAAGCGVVAVVADAATTDTERFDAFLPPRQVFTDDPLPVALIPSQLMLRTFVDLDVLQIDLFDRPIFLTSAIAFAVLMGLVGVGATLASGGTVRSAVLAAIGAAGGALVGDVFVQYGSFEWPRSFFDAQGPTLLVLIPMLLSGIGLGLGALLGRPHGARSTQAAAAAPLAPGYVPPPPPPGPTPAPTAVAPGYAPATGPQPVQPAPAPQPDPSPPVAPEEQPPAAPPPGAAEPPPGATSF